MSIMVTVFVIFGAVALGIILGLLVGSAIVSSWKWGQW